MYSSHGNTAEENSTFVTKANFFFSTTQIQLKVSCQIFDEHIHAAATPKEF